MSTKQPWGEAHKREALCRIYEVAAELVSLDREDDARILMIEVPQRPSRSVNDLRVATEQAWRACLMEARLDPKRIESEVRRVRGLAEGRLHHVSGWRYYVRQPGVLDEDFGTPSGARLAASQRRGAVAVSARITRIRRKVA